MRILIHALAALENGGSDRHLRGMVSVLGSVDPRIEYLLYVNPTFRLTGIPPNVEVRTVSVGGGWNRLWWDQIILPRIARNERVDVIWATLYFGSLWPPVPQIMFQRNAMYYCDRYLGELDIREHTSLRLRRWLLYRTMLASHRIVAPTFAMRDMVRAWHPSVPVERFEVIPHALDLAEGGSVLPADLSPRLTAGDSRAVKLLYVGHLMPFKGLFTLLEALARAVPQVHRQVKLFLTIAREDWPEGYDRFTARVAELGLSQQVDILGKLRGDMIDALYRSSDVLVFPSLCESFGFPLLEAMYAGLPIVAAGTAVNREMAGPAGLYYEPTSVASMTDALVKAIADEHLRSSLADAGRLHLNDIRITWKEYVTRCLNISRH